MYGRPVMALLALVIATIVAACGGGMSEAQIRKTAATWFSDREKAAGQVVRDVRTTDPMRADYNGIPGWEIQVTGVEDGTGTTKVVYLFVDGASGAVSLMGEGEE
jgi:hypothetical protein